MMKLISDEEQIREIEFLETAIEFANAERLWLSKTDYKAAERSSAAEKKLVEMFTEGWADVAMAKWAYVHYRRRLLYKHRTEA
jgi:hypothetical protein